MTHDELLARIKEGQWVDRDEMHLRSNALRAVVELHKPVEVGIGMELNIQNGEPTYTDLFETRCLGCKKGTYRYPCPTIQAIEKELK